MSFFAELYCFERETRAIVLAFILEVNDRYR